MYTSKRGRSYRERKEIAGRRTRRIVLVIVFFLLYELFSIYVSTPLKIAGRSMEPLLRPGDRILFSRVSLDAQSVFTQSSFWGMERGDLVVIRPPFYRKNQGFFDFLNPIVRFFTFQKMQFSTYERLEWEIPYMVKRIIALPGDRVRIENFRAYVTPAGGSGERMEYDLSEDKYQMSRPVLPEGWRTGLPFDGRMEPLTLGEGEFFLLNDSRGNGHDSMTWGGVSGEDILGKVLLRYYPFGRFTSF